MLPKYKDFVNESENVSFKGVLKLFSTSNGGRKGKIGSGYRPNITKDNKQYASIVFSWEGPDCEPGGEVECLMTFIVSSMVDTIGIVSGDKIAVTEGSKHIGDFLVK